MIHFIKKNYQNILAKSTVCNRIKLINYCICINYSVNFYLLLFLWTWLLLTIIIRFTNQIGKVLAVYSSYNKSANSWMIQTYVLSLSLILYTTQKDTHATQAYYLFCVYPAFLYVLFWLLKLSSISCNDILQGFISLWSRKDSCLWLKALITFSHGCMIFTQYFIRCFSGLHTWIYWYIHI